MPPVGPLAYLGDPDATDMRDRIYSLIGLDFGKDKELVVGRPDYHSDVSFVYSKLVKSFVEAHNSPDIICFAHTSFTIRIGSLILTLGCLPRSLTVGIRVESHTVPLMVSQSSRSHLGNFRPLKSMT